MTFINPQEEEKQENDLAIREIRNLYRHYPHWAESKGKRFLMRYPHAKLYPNWPYQSILHEIISSTNLECWISAKPWFGDDFQWPEIRKSLIFETKINWRSIIQTKWTCTCKTIKFSTFRGSSAKVTIQYKMYAKADRSMISNFRAIHCHRKDHPCMSPETVCDINWLTPVTLSFARHSSSSR